MKKHPSLKPVIAALGTSVAISLSAVPLAQANANPFAMADLGSGYMVADSEMKCGSNMGSEMKCGANMGKTQEAKCGGSAPKARDGQCGGAKPKATDGQCGGKKTVQEAKCGEAKCGGNR